MHVIDANLVFILINPTQIAENAFRFNYSIDYINPLFNGKKTRNVHSVEVSVLLKSVSAHTELTQRISPFVIVKVKTNVEIEGDDIISILLYVSNKSIMCMRAALFHF